MTPGAEAITKDVDAIMADARLRGWLRILIAVADEFRSRYPDMPNHLARGLGATYASVVDSYNTRAYSTLVRFGE